MGGRRRGGRRRVRLRRANDGYRRASVGIEHHVASDEESDVFIILVFDRSGKGGAVVEASVLSSRAPDLEATIAEDRFDGGGRRVARREVIASFEDCRRPAVKANRRGE